jgi:hypothetical protein
MPELFTAVEDGKIAVSKAAKLSKATPEMQRAVIAKLDNSDAETCAACMKLPSSILRRRSIAESGEMLALD